MKSLVSRTKTSVLLAVCQITAAITATAWQLSGARDGWAPLSDEAEWNSTVLRSRQPRDVCRAVRQRVTYTRDRRPEDSWQGGKETWLRGAGDCEDFAACVKDICSQKGMSANIYVFSSQTVGKAHAVAIGEWNGRLWLSSNGSYEEVSSLWDARERVAQKCGWWAGDVRSRLANHRKRGTAARLPPPTDSPCAADYVTPSLMPRFPVKEDKPVVLKVSPEYRR